MPGSRMANDIIPAHGEHWQKRRPWQPNEDEALRALVDVHGSYRRVVLTSLRLFGFFFGVFAL
jgi:hypothetical protein